jgi:hypothetical protein
VTINRVWVALDRTTADGSSDIIPITLMGGGPIKAETHEGRKSLTYLPTRREREREWEPERFSSPSARFALQVCILPDNLPDGMIFDLHTEAIVPKSSLRDRSLSNAAASTQRRKVLQFPKNTTVAEVIELALERFGIAEGVVDGGDKVEDKLAKRISLARVRYGLAVQMDGRGECIIRVLYHLLLTCLLHCLQNGISSLRVKCLMHSKGRQSSNSWSDVLAKNNDRLIPQCYSVQERMYELTTLSLCCAGQ